jgi:hypothetical protein
MNTSLLSKDYDEIKGNVNIIPYQINRLGLYPFLQYFLLKYNTNLEEQEDSLDFENETTEEKIKQQINQKRSNGYVSFLKFDQLNFMPILETCVAALEILFLSFGELDPKYEYKGHILYEGEYYMFFDCSEYQILTHNLNKQNDIWLTLVDEIINYKMVCQFNIDDKVSKFFLNHQEYIKLEQPDSNPIIYYESPIIAYAGCTSKKRDFISTFGQLPDTYDGLYHFTQFDNVYIDTSNKCSGIIRFAIFHGNMRVLIDKNEHENILATEEDEEETTLTDWTIYDSLYLDKTWIIKNYNQQTILTSHLRENDKLYII